VFKKSSPSCGIARVRLYDEHGRLSRKGVGLFARAFVEQFPLIPVEEEGRLCDLTLRENFIERVFCYRRWRNLVQSGVTREALARFHRIHTDVLMAHSPQQCAILDRLIGQADRYRLRELASRYGKLFMDTVAVKATVRKHVKVLNHILGHFKERLSAYEKAELLGVIGDYDHGLTPLVVPLTLIKHYVQIFDINHLRAQIYLNPNPQELMLRNHV
jgi:uncharacterized protein YbgA (DUF1722 family)